jgi:hypothetical protein
MLNNKKVSFVNNNSTQPINNKNNLENIVSQESSKPVLFTQMKNYCNNNTQYITPNNLNQMTSKVSNANFTMNLAQENQLRQLQYLNYIHKKNMYEKQLEKNFGKQGTAKTNPFRENFLKKEIQKVNQNKIFAIKKSIY